MTFRIWFRTTFRVRFRVFLLLLLLSLLLLLLLLIRDLLFSDLIIKEHHLIKKHQNYCLERLNSTEIYNMQFILNVEKPTAETYFDKKIYIYIPYLDV